MSGPKLLAQLLPILAKNMKIEQRIVFQNTPTKTSFSFLVEGIFCKTTPNDGKEKEIPSPTNKHN